MLTVVRCSLCVGLCLLFPVCWLGVCCLYLVDYFALPGVRCLLFVACCSLFGGGCLLGRLLFVV